MAEILSPGVFIEEVASGQNVVQAVSTSNLGAIGFMPQGPTDTATLVTNFPQFERIFGADNKSSRLSKQIAAFYANGGSRAFIVRVMPSDSVKADGRIQSTTYNQLLETGIAATTTYVKTDATSSIKDNAGATPVIPGSFTAKFRGDGMALTADPAMARDGVTALVCDGTSTGFEGRINPYNHVTTVTNAGAIYFRGIAPGSGQGVTVAIIKASATATALRDISVVGNAITVKLATTAGAPSTIDATETAASIAGAINAHPSASALVFAIGPGAGVLLAEAGTLTLTGGAPAVDDALDMVVSGSTKDVTVLWSAGAKSLVFLGNSAGPVVAATSADGSGVFDRRTGIFSVAATVAPTAAPVTVTVTMLASATYTVTSGTSVASTGRVALLGSALSGGGDADCYLNVADGSYSIKLAAAANFHTGGKLLATYKTNAWDVRPISNGVWGNNLKVDIKGNADYYSATTNSYSRFNVNVLLKDSFGNYNVVEPYEELVFDDATSGVYFPDVLNELSDLVTVVDAGQAGEAPGELAGVAHSYSVGGGNGNTSGKAFSFTLAGAPVSPRSVVVSYVSSVDGATYTITDDGVGAMTGSVDGTGTNTTTYSTGAVSFSTANPIKAGTLVTIAYCSAAQTTHSEMIGDATAVTDANHKAYSYTLTTGGLQSFYTNGTDGTFSGTTWSRNQFTAPTLVTPGLGLYALNRIDELMQVIIPDFAGDVLVTGDLLDYAESRASLPSGGDRFVILTVPKGSDAQESVDWLRYSLKRFSKFAAVYWPWVTVADPLSNGRNLTVPPLGHIAGIYARTDATKNVGKSPGGTVDGQLRYLTGLERVSTLGERDFVYPNRINPLISSTQTGMAVWGVRTIAIESEWRYINARRLFMFLEKSVFNATHWVVFENNGPALWTKIKAQINGFLSGLFNEGYFAGNSTDQAFFVICDETNNSQASIDAGQVIIDVGVAPNKPAEFVRFRFQQKAL
jgi:phage tail sheath protein FI